MSGVIAAIALPPIHLFKNLELAMKSQNVFAKTRVMFSLVVFLIAAALRGCSPAQPAGGQSLGDLTAKANSGDAQAMCELGHRYQAGQGI